MLVIFPVHHRIELLPYFLSYYTSLGATEFVCGLYHGVNNPFYREIRSYAPHYPLTVDTSIIPSPLEKFYCDATVTRGLNRIRNCNAGKHPWYCVADLDEFYYFSGRSLPEVVRYAEQRACDAVHGTFVDRIAADGSFPDINGPLDGTFPLACNLTASAGRCKDKIALARNYVPLVDGHHKAKANVCADVAEVHHFKWYKGVREYTAAALHGHAQHERLWATQHLPKLLDFINNRVDLTCPELCVRPAVKLGI